MRSIRSRLKGGLTPRTRRMFSTAAASYLARFGSALTLFITIPLARQTLSAELFGVWMMLSALVGFFSFADLGVGNGVLNRMTAAHSRGDRTAAARVMVAGYSCTSAAALLLLVVWFACLLSAQDPLAFAGTISNHHREEVLWAFSTFALMMALNLPAGLIQKFQLGCQDGQWVGLSQFFAAMGSLIAVPAALYWQLGLPSLVLASLGMQVLANLVNSALWLHRRGYFAGLKRRFLERESVKALLRTGLMFFVLQLCAAFAFQSDAFVIAQVLGQPAYGDFAAVQKIFLSVSTLVGAALLGLWPAFGEALQSGDVAWARQTLQRALVTGLAVMGSLCLGLVFSMGWLAQVWLKMPPPPLLLTALLALWTVIETLGLIVGSMFNGAGILRAQVLLALIVASVSFSAKWWLVEAYGAWGAVLATIAAYCLISVPFQILLLRRLFREHAHTPTLPSFGRQT